MKHFAIGYDLGSSSVKGALSDVDTGQTLARAQHPATEMPIDSLQHGWAEQDPAMWWESICAVTKDLAGTVGITPSQIKAVGIAYQMHGLVLVDSQLEVLRPSIIWCDSRAVELGENAFDALGHEACLDNYLNSPGNFTASKMCWVVQNEPDLAVRTAFLMLPGDYIAMRLTGLPTTTVSGLSEGVLWNFKKHDLAHEILAHYGIRNDLVPPIVETFGVQGHVSGEAAAATGLPEGVPVTYRAGDQPNNAFALGVMQPGEVAGTCGTSGVVYGIANDYVFDAKSRINGFAHVNHTAQAPRVGMLLCINGAGILHAWMRRNVSTHAEYAQIEEEMQQVPIGSEGLIVMPFGNGAERILENRDLGGSITNLLLNRHHTGHMLRASVEGIAFAFAYGIQILRDTGLQVDSLSVGNDNLFQSSVFAATVATTARCTIRVKRTSGAEGAARGASYGAGLAGSLSGLAAGIEKVAEYQPDHENARAYDHAYQAWLEVLASQMRR